MKAVLLGTGFAVPSRDRVQAGILVDTGGDLLLLDCGEGILHRIQQSGYDFRAVTHILLTHFHLDHNADLFPLLKAMALSGVEGMAISGPRGLEDWLGHMFRAYPYLKGRLDIRLTELEGGETMDVGGGTVKCAPTSHSPRMPSLAYRIEGQGKSLVYSGDTEPCEGVRDLCEAGADVLVHECSSEERIEGHTDPATLAEFLEGLPVRRLVLTHFSPETAGREEGMAEVIRKKFPGEIIVGHDLMELEI
jgi:ribonuclease BN (tRNA processing enzyme)